MRNTINKHQEHSEQTYKAILDAAFKLYLKKGIGETTIQEIAKEIGSHRTTVYRYFSSHEEIGFAISKETQEPMIKRYYDELKPLLEKEGNGWEKLAIVVRTANKLAREYPDLFKFYAIFDAYLALRPNQEAIGNELNNTFGTDTFIQLEKKYIDQGIEDGSIRDDLDPLLAAVTIRALYVASWARVNLRNDVFKFHHGIQEPELIGDIACELYLSGMKADKKPSA